MYATQNVRCVGCKFKIHSTNVNCISPKDIFTFKAKQEKICWISIFDVVFFQTVYMSIIIEGNHHLIPLNWFYVCQKAGHF